jgi:apolipoprotein N-acyltransferase
LHQYLDFTWLHFGNAAANMSVLMRLAPYTGVYGVSFALAMMNVAVALVLLRRPRVQLAWLALLPLLFLLPALPEPKPGTSTARLVQPNIHPDALISGVWTPARSAQHLERMKALSTVEADEIDPTLPQLLIWPEYPVPAYFFDSPGWRAFMENLARQVGAYFIFNTVAFEETNGRRPLNGAVTLSPSGAVVSRYAKIFLVPFGEFVPWPFSLFVDKITLEAGDFAPGNDVAVALAGEHRIGTFICYESAFARGIREFAARGAEVLVTLSNDSWYGRSAARRQHLLLARMRAVENGRWLLRATNDGITCAIDPAGRVVAALPSFEEGVLCARFNYESHRTWFVRFGQWFWWTCVAATGAFLVVARRQGTPAGG